MGCLPVVARFRLDRPYILESVAAFGELSVLSDGARREAYRDRGWRARALTEMTENRAGRTFEFDWSRMSVSESAVHGQFVGRSLADIAAERGTSALDVMVDLALEDRLETRFEFELFNWDQDEVGALLKQDSTILGLSDAGAHASQLCDASYALHLLGHFVRERREFSLEFGVWRLTGHPATALGFEGRGFLRSGHVADICVFDAETIAERPAERVYDLPGGADRLVKEPVGVEAVLVNGTFIRRDGMQLDVAPGRVLR
jgi:N-acyl-D-aspartate/D-glutamate deacylase